MTKLTAKQKKKIAQVWAGEILNSTDIGFDTKELGITDKDLNDIHGYLLKIANGFVLEGNKMGTLKEIINRVKKEF